jgi:hypothetical protein
MGDRDAARNEVDDEEEPGVGGSPSQPPGGKVHDIKQRPLRDSRRVRSFGRSSTEANDAGMLNAHSRLIEVEGASDRLGLAEMRTTLESSEGARRELTADILHQADRHDRYVDRLRDEYEEAADRAEKRHDEEMRRSRADRDRLARKIEELEKELKDEKKEKKRAKKSIANLELKIEEIRESGQKRRDFLGFFAPSVPILATTAAEYAPGVLSFIRSVMGPVVPQQNRDDSESVLDRAAAIRFAGRLFDVRNAEILSDLQSLAFDVVDDGIVSRVVPEWPRVQRYILNALRGEAEAANGNPEVVEAPSE